MARSIGNQSTGTNGGVCWRIKNFLKESTRIFGAWHGLSVESGYHLNRPHATWGSLGKRYQNSNGAKPMHYRLYNFLKTSALAIGPWKLKTDSTNGYANEKGTRPAGSLLETMNGQYAFGVESFIHCPRNIRIAEAFRRGPHDGSLYFDNVCNRPSDCLGVVA